MAESRALYIELLEKLRSTRRKERTLTLSSALLKTATVAILLLLLVSLVETFAHGNIAFRSFLAGFWALGTLAAGVFYLGKIVLKKSHTEEQMAMRVGRVYPEIEDRLCNALQLFSGIEQERGTSNTLALAAFQNVAVTAREKDFDAVIDKEEPKRALYTFFGALVLTLALFAGFQSSLGAGLGRVVNFQKSFLPPAPFTISIEPRSKNILRGEKASITVIAKGQIPEIVVLKIREEQQEEFDSYTLRSDSAGIFLYEIGALKRSVEFYAEVPWLTEFVRTDVGRITVSDRPMIRSLSGRLTPPGYTGLASQQLSEQAADISALRGSRAEFQVLANKDLASAEIILLKNRAVSDSLKTTAADTARIPLKVSGRQANGGFNVSASGTYYFLLKDKNGETNPEPVRYSVTALNDGFPTISLIEPSTDAQVGEDAMLPLKVAITDDYGFAALQVKYRLAESKYAKAEENFKTINVPLAQGQTAQEVPYLWDLGSTGITPGDRYEFFVEVFDNDRASGPKSAKTSVLSVRLPSLDEILNEADKEQEQIAKDLEKVFKSAEEVRKEAEELQRELMKNQQKPLDWKDKKKAEELMKKQQDLQKKMEDVQQQLQETTEKLQQNNVLSPETLQKYMELQKLMKQVNSQELQKYMEKMQQMMQQMTPEQMQQAMKNFQFNEEEFKKGLERTMKLLQRMQAEQKTDALTKRAEELQKKQEDLQKQAENTNPQDKAKRDELAKQQDQLQKDMDALQKEMKELEDLMKEIGKDMPMQEMDKAKQELNSEETQQQMEQAEQDMQKGDMQSAQKKQEKAKDNLKKFAQQMKKMKKEMQKNSSKEAVREMQRSINDMLALSKQEEQLKRESQSMDPNSTKFQQNAQQQAKLKQSLNDVANRMAQLSQKSFAVTPEMAQEIGTALKEMQEATQELSNRQGQQAGQSQNEAMAAMNRATMQMQDAMNKMQGQGEGEGEGEGEGQGQGKGGQGFMQKMQQAAQQQQGINQSMQQMGQGGQLSPQQQAEMGRLAGQQGRVQKSIQELAKEQKQSGGDKKALGDLEKLAQDMQEVMSDMQSGNITEATRQRQEKILSRLLDASRSMNERDFEKQRESQSGKDVLRNSPSALDLNTKEGKERAMQELMRSIQQGYSKDYEALIRQYFEALNKK